jgi:hypothetical protein
MTASWEVWACARTAKASAHDAMPGILTQCMSWHPLNAMHVLASCPGILLASLATLFVMGYGGESWEKRRARAAELYALAHAQGFTAFGGLTQGEGPGEPYLSMLERYASSAGCPLPGESDPGG